MTTFVKTFAPAFPNLANRFFEEYEHQAKANQFSLPAVNVLENEATFELHLAAPGLEKTDFTLNVHEKTLTISAEKKNVEAEAKPHFSRKEFDFSTFKRAFTLPKSVDVDNIMATYTNGVLHVTLPKLEEAKPKEPRAVAVA